MNQNSAAREGAGQGGLPPYTAFQSIKTALGVLKEHGVPNRIDRSVWGNKFSGAVVTQVLTSLRFLGLMSQEGVPADNLKPLANALETDQWAPMLKKVIEKAYAPIFDLNLESATPSEFFEKFREAFKAEGETARKCVTFFLNAARDAGIPVSPYLLSNAKPRTNGGARRKGRAKRAVEDTAAREPVPVPPPPVAPGGDLHPFIQGLLKTLPSPETEWSLGEQAKWLKTAASIFGLIYKSEPGFVEVEAKSL
jgi:hypothetical protein